MLVNMKEILKEAEEKGYAIGCINTPNMETLRAVVDAAEELNVPIIIDHAQVHDPLIPMESIGPKMVEYAKQAKVPVCVHLDHGSDYSFVMRAIRCGFSSIMYDLSALPFEENMAKLKEFTKIAHDLNITVEAELGIMTSTEEDSHGGSIGWTHESIKKTFTDPQQAAEFARETGVDALAVCFGTAHGIYAEPPLLDIERNARGHAWRQRSRRRAGTCSDHSRLFQGQLLQLHGNSRKQAYPGIPERTGWKSLLA